MDLTGFAAITKAGTYDQCLTRPAYLLSGRWRGDPQSVCSLSSEQFNCQLNAALLWRWIIQWAPLLGKYSDRLQPDVRERLYAAFEHSTGRP